MYGAIAESNAGSRCRGKIKAMKKACFYSPLALLYERRQSKLASYSKKLCRYLCPEGEWGRTFKFRGILWTVIAIQIGFPVNLSFIPPQDRSVYLRHCAWRPVRMPGIALVAVILSVLMSGCGIKRDHYDVPAVLLSDQYRQSTFFPKAGDVLPPAGENPVPAEPVATSPAKVLTEADLDEWWRPFGNAELNSLIGQALANNVDLRIAMLRLAQSQARANQAEANQYPVVTAPLEMHYDAPPNGVNSAQINSNTQAKHREYYQAGLRGAWNVDVWGEQRSLAESAKLQLWQATYKSDDVRRTLIANVVSKYIEYLSLNDRLRVARETETVLNGMLQAVSDRVKAGDATIIDLEQQRSADFAVHATIPGLELQRKITAHALAQMLGITPSALTLSDKGMDSLVFPGALPSVPTSLLVRRPDIRAVEARLLAADADIDVARARLFPPLTLTAQGSVGLLTYAQLFFAPYGVLYNAIGNLTTTIFDHGKRTQDVAYARSVHEELVETYLHTVYSAVRETEDAIVSTHLNGNRLEAQKVATEAALRAWLASRESYEVGGIDFLTLIDTQRTYHRVLDEYHHIRQERFNSLVSLYSALGGGVQQGGVIPGEGVRPQGESVQTAMPNTEPGIDWTGGKADMDDEFWLVELAGLHDRSGVTHAWRDLQQRFPGLMTDYIALPRLQGKVTDDQQERATWYRVFIARFPSQEEAGAFCLELNVKQVRCNPVSSKADEFSDFMEDEPANEAALAKEHTVKPVQRNPDRQSDKVEAKPLTLAANSPKAGEKKVSASPVLLGEGPGAVLGRKDIQKDKGTQAAKDDQDKVTDVIPARVISRGADTGQAKSKPSPLRYAVQLHTMSIRSNAENVAATWNRKGYKAYVNQELMSNGTVVYAVRVGTYSSIGQAAEHAVELSKREQVDAIPVSIGQEQSAKTAIAKSAHAR